MNKPEIIITLTAEESDLLEATIEALIEHIESTNAIVLLNSIKNKISRPDEANRNKEVSPNESEEIIEEYNDKIFWKELIERLATKKMIKHYGKEAIENMSDKEFEDIFESIEDPIIEEISKNGIANIVIDKMI